MELNYQLICLDRKKAQTTVISLPHLHISIYDPDKTPPDLPSCNNRIARLDLSFDDISYESEFDISFTKSHAHQIYQFIKDHINSVKLIVINCEMGVSRSSAIAAALDEILNIKDESDFFYKLEFSPNMLVYKKIKEYYSSRINNGFQPR